ncbi:MAG: MFS transporter [Acidimicrobiales bacterium]|nr:MFS transporter [Acidimicrobiales bacterium]
MVVLFVLSFLLAAGNGAIFALLPQIQEAADLPDWSLGVVVAASFGAGLVSQLALARFADRGHARLLLAGGAVVAAVGYIVVGLGGQLITVAGGRAIAGLGIGAVYPAGRKLLVARYPDQAGLVLGRFLASDVTGFVLGAPIGAEVADRFGVAVTFGCFAAAIVICLPLVLRTRWPVSAASVATARADRGVLRRLLGRSRLRAGLALGAATFFAIGVFDTLWARYLTDLGASTRFIGVTLACFGVPMALVATFAGRLADRSGPLRIGLVAGFAGVPFMISYGQLSVPITLAVVSTIHAVIDGLGMPASQATVAAECDEHEMASGQGLLSSVQMSTAALAALLIAPVYDRFGAGMSFGLAGAMMALALLAAWQQSGLGRRRTVDRVPATASV